jgi:hypothetical protein
VTIPRSRRRVHTAIVLAVVLAFAAVGCGGSSDGAETTTTTTAPPPPTVVQSACDDALELSTPGTLEGTNLNEISGLVLSEKNASTVWLNNDSGESARVFAVSPNGTLQGSYPLEGATAIDWEDIAIGPGPEALTSYLYVGDIGDNAAVRPSIVVYRFPEPFVVGDGVAHPQADVDALTFTYPDGPHDAEALMVDPRSGAIYIIVKELAGGPAGVYRARANLKAGSTTVLTKVGEIALPRVPMASAVTAADISRDGRAIGVRTYGGVRLWELGPDQSVIDALDAKPCRGPIPDELQGETIGLQPDARSYFTVSEGVSVPLHQYSALDFAVSPAPGP